MLRFICDHGWWELAAKLEDFPGKRFVSPSLSLCARIGILFIWGVPSVNYRASQVVQW